MEYVDFDYFKDEYGGNENVTQGDFDKLIKRAIRLARLKTDLRLTPTFFDKAHPNIQEMIKNALCSQIEYDMDTGANSEATAVTANSLSVGNFSYSKGTRSSKDVVSDSSQYSENMIDFLQLTGLMYQGVARI